MYVFCDMLWGCSAVPVLWCEMCVSTVLLLAGGLVGWRDGYVEGADRSEQAGEDEGINDTVLRAQYVSILARGSRGKGVGGVRLEMHLLHIYHPTHTVQAMKYDYECDTKITIWISQHLPFHIPSPSYRAPISHSHSLQKPPRYQKIPR